MRNYKEETEKRVEFIKNLLKQSGAKGIVYGNSGGKDCTLVSILCKKATENVLGVIMPCHSKQNYGTDFEDAEKVANQFDIKNIVVDLSQTKSALVSAFNTAKIDISDAASTNIQPRLRMTTLYAIAHTRGALVAGTGNRSESYMGYFTKFGDGNYDFNVISDLTVTEIYEFLVYLGAPESIITKKPSAGLFEGQTDEDDMGVTYAEIDEYLTTGKTNERAKKIIERYHNASEHKRNPAPTF
ncbi:MAG: NAD(+) synthase [Clostridia bacterium]